MELRGRRPAKKPQSVSSAGLIIIPRREKCNGKGGESLITCAVGGPMPAFLPRVEKSRKYTEQKESAERNNESTVQTEGTLSAVQTEAIKKRPGWKIRVLSPRLSAVPVRKEAGRKAHTKT